MCNCIGVIESGMSGNEHRVTMEVACWLALALQPEDFSSILDPGITSIDEEV